MPEPLYLSLWLREFTGQEMLRYWASALEQFPQSSLSPGIREVAVYPFEWSEAPVMEQSFPEGATWEHAAALAAEFLHDDYAYEARLKWDVWAPQDGPPGPQSLDKWKKLALPVSLACLGPHFEPEEQTGRAHLQLDLGLDSLFLPPEDMPSIEQVTEGIAASCYRDNIAQLLRYIRRLEDTLPLVRRRLWSGSGEDFGARIRSAWRLAPSP